MNILKTLAVSAVLALGASAVSAATYLGTFEGNDSLDGLVIEKLDIDSPGLWKCEASRGGCYVDAYTEYSTQDAFKVTLETFKDDDDGEAIGGRWGWSGEGILAPHYMVVKGGPNGYSVWDIAGETSGFWNTQGLGNASLSHISFYNTGVSEVPLPASALLLLGGLGGLVAMRRRRK